MFKNQLQQLAQKSGHPLPIYTTIMEGPAHSPQFKSSVVVEGVRFEPPEKFSSKKEAEQHAARVAYEELQKKERDPLQLIRSKGPRQLICSKGPRQLTGSRDPPPLIGSQDPLQLIGSDATFCRSILQEFSVKMNLQKPEYKCFQAEGLLPAFFSTVELSGSVFEGVIGRNKGESNQLAARAAIQSILVHGYPEWKAVMTQIVGSKSKLYAAISQCKVDPDRQVLPLIRPVGPINHTQTNVNRDGHLAHSQPPIAQQEQLANGEPRTSLVGPIGQIKIKPDPDGHVAQPGPIVAQQEQLPGEQQSGPGGQSQTDVDQDGHVAQSQPLPNWEPVNTPVGPIGQSQLNVEPDRHVAQSQPLVQSEEQPISEPQNTTLGPGPDGHVAQSQVEVEEQPIRGSLDTPVGPGSQLLTDPSGHVVQPQPPIGQQEEQSQEGAPSTPGGPDGKSQIGVDSGGQQDEKLNGGAVEMEEELATEDPVVNALTSEEKAEESVEEPENEDSDRSGNVKRLKITIM